MVGLVLPSFVLTNMDPPLKNLGGAFPVSSSFLFDLIILSLGSEKSRRGTGYDLVLGASLKFLVKPVSSSFDFLFLSD